MEQVAVLVKAHRFELETAGIEAAPDGEDAGVKRDAEKINYRRRHQQIGKCLAHHRIAPALARPGRKTIQIFERDINHGKECILGFYSFKDETMAGL